MATIPIVNAKSATLLTTNAFIADLLACIRVCQKLIKRYEHKPTPSHPKNSKTKFSPVIKINIKNVKSERYETNLLKWGSSHIYEIE